MFRCTGARRLLVGRLVAALAERGVTVLNSTWRMSTSGSWLSSLVDAAHDRPRLTGGPCRPPSQRRACGLPGQRPPAEGEVCDPDRLLRLGTEDGRAGPWPPAESQGRNPAAVPRQGKCRRKPISRRSTSWRKPSPGNIKDAGWLEIRIRTQRSWGRPPRISCTAPEISSKERRVPSWGETTSR